MYCSTCGNQIKKGLKYCNSCGVRIFDFENEKSSSWIKDASKPMVFIAIGAILGFMGLVKILLESNLPPEATVIIVLGFLATFFGISYLLIKQLSGVTRHPENNRDFPSDIPQAIKPANTRQLEEPREPPASVVENTTRTLDEIPVERK